MLQDHVQDFVNHLLTALGVATDGALVSAGHLSRLGCEALRHRVDKLSRRSALVAAMSRLGVQFLVDRLPPRRLPSPVGRRQFRPHQVLVDHREFGVEVVGVVDDGLDIDEAEAFAGDGPGGLPSGIRA